MACPRLLGKSCGFSNGKYLFAIVRDEPRHCSYTKRSTQFEKNIVLKRKMKLTNEQFEASAYIFEKANGNKKTEYEENLIAESGLAELKPDELKIQIINGLNSGLYSDSKERISAYWTLSKVHDSKLIPDSRKWLKTEFGNSEPLAVYQLINDCSWKFGRTCF